MSEWKERKMTAPGSGRRSKRSSGHHHNGGDSDDDNDDDSGDIGDNNGDGTGANSGGGSALNSSYQAFQNASNASQGQPATHSFGSTYANFKVSQAVQHHGHAVMCKERPPCVLLAKSKLLLIIHKK
jgi:hypothetical protein